MTQFAVPLDHAPSPVSAEVAWLAAAAAAGLPIVAGFVVTSSHAGEIRARPPDDVELQAGLEQAWNQIGRPAEISLSLSPGQSDATASPASEERHRVADEAALARLVVQELAGIEDDQTTLLVQAAAYPSAWGTIYSDDPREDRVDWIHVDAWASPARSTSRPTRYRRPRAGGATWSTTDAGSGALSSSQLAALLLCLAEAEAIALEPLALDWVFDDEQPRIRSLRPLASPLPWAINRDQPQDHDNWSRTNAGEIFPLPMTPMTWSLMGEPLNGAFISMYHNPAWTAGRRFVGLADGHVYFNMGFVSRLTVETLGFPAREMDAAIGGPGASEGLIISRRSLHIPSLLSNIPWIWRRTRSQRNLPQQWLEMRAETEHLRDHVAGLDLSQMDSRAILSELNTTGTWVQGLANFLMDAQSAAFGTFGLVSFLLNRWLGSDDDAPALIQGLPGIRTAEGNVELWKLARRAAEDGAARSLVESTPPENLLDALRGDETSPWLADGIDAFLAEYGHRSAGELELMEPRWSDDPALILRPFREYVLHPTQASAEELFERQVRSRQTTEAEIRARLGTGLQRFLPWRWLILKDYLKWAQAYAPLRENPKFSLLALVQQQRRLLFELADRLVEQGGFEERDDVFFVFREELEQLVAEQGEGEPSNNYALGRYAMGRTRSRVRRRRAQYALWSQRNAPAVLGPRLRMPEQSPELRPPAARVNETLTGLGASPGIAEGEALVATTAAEGNRIVSGQVLIARFTDPGWTPVFPIAAAVVTDIGGRLSHGAIVAREYGIPAVVNVRRATETIVSGQRVRVDGTKGTVEILSAPPTPSA
jgi:pyruvate,water dikinase